MKYQFFYGKDENNLDKEWGYPVRFDVDGRVVSFSVTDEQTPPLRVNPGPHMTTLFVNGVPTIKNDVVVNQQEVKIVPHSGGVFRHYGTKEKIESIIAGNKIKLSPYGDLYDVLPPVGAAVYLTDLNLQPINLHVRQLIAKTLRILNTDSFDALKLIKPGEEKEEQLRIQSTESYIDLVNINDMKIDPKYKNQFAYPNELLFDNTSVFGINRFN